MNSPKLRVVNPGVLMGDCLGATSRPGWGSHKTKKAVFWEPQRNGQLHVPNRGFLLACGRGTEGWGTPPGFTCFQLHCPGLTSMCDDGKK